MYNLSPAVIRDGCSLKELINHRRSAGSFSGDVERYCDGILTRIAQKAATSSFVETIDGRIMHIVERPMPDGGWVVTHEDVSERRRAEARIAHLAHHDALTGLPNRLLLRQQLEPALKLAMRGEKLALLYLDLDNFKTINDTLGHLMGDELLKAVADRLRSCVRDIDVVARLGGDEFAIIQTKIKHSADAAQLATRLRDTIIMPYDLPDGHVIVDTSIGIAIAPHDGVSPDQLLKNADLALYAAKGGGRGAHRFFEPTMDKCLTVRRNLEFDLRMALRRGEFELHYQPVVNLENNQVVACEALLRWNHPERGLISPAEFIPVAEETGLIVRLGEWVVQRACAEAKTWPCHMKISVNVSPVQFKRCDLVEVVVNALNAAGLPADRLEIEITEALLMQDTGPTLDVLRRLHDLGVRIALDDFGTGYSSFGYLQSFPIDKIKIDQTFIRKLSHEAGSAAIVRTIADLAKNLRMITTAEGVETDEQRQIAKSSGCTEMQGYLFSCPKTAADIAKLWFQMSRKGETYHASPDLCPGAASWENTSDILD
jgi:diguanylate cyclase (GGDEF)-like protein